MSRVFSERDIRLQHVPLQDSFPVALSGVKNCAQELYDNGSLYGMLVVGSGARNQAGIRSDLDFIGVWKEHPAAQTLYAKCAELESQTHIPIHPILMPKERARVFDAINYLLFAQTPTEGNLIGNNPLEVISPRRKSPVRAWEQYVSSKRIALSEPYPYPQSPQYYGSLSETLDLPRKLALKLQGVLACLGLNIPYEYVLQGFPEIMNLSANLRRENTNYDTVLESVLAGTSTLTEYHDYLEYLADVRYPQAIDLITLTQTYIPDEIKRVYADMTQAPIAISTTRPALLLTH